MKRANSGVAQADENENSLPEETVEFLQVNASTRPLSQTLAEQQQQFAYQFNEEKNFQEAPAVTMLFQCQQTAVLQQRQPAVEEERKLNFDNISAEDRALFMAGLSPDRKKLGLLGFEGGDSPEISSINIFLHNNRQATHFRWGGADVSDSEFATLVRIPSLKSLELPNCTQLTNTGIQALNGNTTFESLLLLRCDQMTVAGLRDLATMERLQSLVLDTGANVIDLKILADLPELRSLTLYCAGIQVASLPKLESLTLMGVALTDADLEALQNNNPALRCLALNGCTGMTDVAKATIDAMNARESARETDQHVVLTFLAAMKKATKDKDKVSKDKEVGKKSKPVNPLYDLSKPAVEDMLENPLYDPMLLRVIAETTLPLKATKISMKNTFH